MPLGTCLRPVVRVLLFLSFVFLAAGEEQIKWTPNEDAENAPLPLSMRQRQQLLQLDQTIRSSPDPNGTLQQVAQQNGMSPQDLVNMLEKNARDLQQDPSLLKPKTVVSVLAKVLTSAGILVSQSAKKNPRSFALTASILIFLIYAKIMIPRTGLHVSRGTTLFAPHQRYLQQLADSPTLERRPLSIKTKKIDWGDLKLGSDGVEVHRLPRSSELSQAVSAQVTIPSADFLETNDDEEEAQEHVLDLLFENLVSSSNRFLWR